MTSYICDSVIQYSVQSGLVRMSGGHMPMPYPSVRAMSRADLVVRLAVVDRHHPVLINRDVAVAQPGANGSRSMYRTDQQFPCSCFLTAACLRVRRPCMLGGGRGRDPLQVPLLRPLVSHPWLGYDEPTLTGQYSRGEGLVAALTWTWAATFLNATNGLLYMKS